ncbi:macro domain-containing protein [Sphingosinicella sp. BN140058]|uniref:macro domain-containing protein n=1 Tax=Sphingosinicella sp. BN140058 TaxID=1892855 RepID=UPI001013AE98|nr:macro domain-containing protein [Sphingosinicella sp. BN140058]QAY80310.1 hypothetical protein ETR14_27080 [Sphingosinicella sp. BN140058]
MTEIAQALEVLGFTLRSGFAGGADTAFELGTTREDLREIFAPWRGFGANPNSKWDKPRWDQIRRHERLTGKPFRPAKQLLLAGEYIGKAEILAARYHRLWNTLPRSFQQLHSRNMGQVLGARLDTPARFVICWTEDGEDSGGTGQAIRTADDLGICVLNLHDLEVRAEILRVLGIALGPATSASPSECAGGAGAGSVRYCSGNIVDDGADLLVNTNNVVSVAGAGVALAFKKRFPEIMPDYVGACRSRRLKPGGCLLFPLPDGRRWAALATKDHWRDPSQLSWVESGLRELATLARAAGIRSIALPAPGCGNGGLDFRTVEPLVLDILSGFDLRIYARSTRAA